MTPTPKDWREPNLPTNFGKTKFKIEDLVAEARQAELSRVIRVIQGMPYTGYSEDINGNIDESIYKSDLINKLKNNE